MPEPAADNAGDGRPAEPAGSAGRAPGPAEGAASQRPGRAAGSPASAQMPWSGPARKADILCWVGIMLSGIYYLVLLPFRADLVGTHPVALVLLNGSTEGIVAAAAFARIGHGTLLVVMLAAIPGLMKFDLLYWWAGRLWGERFIGLLSGRRKRGGRYLEWVRRRGRLITWPALVVGPFVPIPNAIIYVVAGWTGMSWITFLVLDLIGNMLWAGMLAGLGYALGHHAVVVAQTISHYGLWFTLAIIALIVIGQVRRARADQRTISADPAPGGGAQDG
ncbi:MAG TPA: VTT domain-containing protein [Streptosporangiaceae bacterium]